MSKMNLKADALSAYEAAVADPLSADWRAVAELLRASVPTPKAKAGDAWADYAVECPGRKIVWPSPVIVATFADGEKVRMSFACLPGKPLNIGRGLRLAAAAWETRILCRLRRDGARLADRIAEHVDIRNAIDSAELALRNAAHASERAEEALEAHNAADPEDGDWLAWHKVKHSMEQAIKDTNRDYTHALTAVSAARNTARAVLVESKPLLPEFTAVHVECEGVVLATYAAADVNTRMVEKARAH